MVDLVIITMITVIKITVTCRRNSMEKKKKKKQTNKETWLDSEIGQVNATNKTTESISFMLRKTVAITL